VRRLLLLLLLAIGCSDGPEVAPESLALVIVAPAEEDGLPEQFHLVFRALAASEPDGPVDLRLPLPEGNVTMLAWETGPDAHAALRDGVLHVTSPDGFPDVVVRAIVELPSGSLPPGFRELVAGPVHAEAGGRTFEVTLDGTVD
jgi:hypothetical protein